MSRNGSGTYTLPAGNPVVTGTTISSTWSNNTLSDIATALTGSVAADGQTTMTGNLQMGGQKITNLGTATVGTDAVNYTLFLNGNFVTTAQITLPVGTTAQRSASPTNGMIRYNSDYGQFEGYQNGQWSQVGGGATGGGGDQVFVENSRVVTTNYTLSTGKSAESVGPITINSGVTVTIPSGQRWVVL